ncbi:unnamed protein product [Rotaria sp. Silwood1]|nr:unnamed protein product [Rotaria sp. Silwood1]
MDSLSNCDLLQAFDVYCSKEGVAGNGALMRLAPVPLFFWRRPAVAVDYSGISGKITHGDKRVYDACCYYGALIVAALKGETKDDLLSEKFYTNHREWFGDEDLHDDIKTIACGSYKKSGGYHDGIRGKGFIVNALEAALWAFWSDGNSFETGAINAVNLGDDTDTTAAIYGQLAGAHYGYEKLPEKWLNCIYAKDFILCVSSWITYEGERWFKNHTVPIISTLINSFDNTLYNSRPSDSINLTTPRIRTSLEITSGLDIALGTIVRKTINPNGRIGVFYDAWHDRIVETSSIQLNIKEGYSNLPIKLDYRSAADYDIKRDDNDDVIERNEATTTVRDSLAPSPKQFDLSPAVSSTDQKITIVLIGKSGVGKSMLINTIANCLKFKELPQVKSTSSAMHVAVPFLFPLKTDICSRFILVGKDDSNENCGHRYPGQPRTQRCKLHTFDIENGQNLCIVDTPGFSDTGNQPYNETTIQHILQCISNIFLHIPYLLPQVYAIRHWLNK